MRVLVTGANGMLGRDLCGVFEQKHEVIATDIEEMDVTDHALLLKTVNEVRPDLVVHLAGVSDMDRCEKEPDLAYSVNTLGTKNVALACQRTNALMTYVSTLSVFEGTKCEPYTELDKPNPQSQYAKVKYQGEIVVRDFLDRYYIVRAGWLFGGGPQDNEFVGKTIDLARTGTELMVVNDKFGSPTYTKDLASGMLRLVATGQYGTYHMVNTGPACSRYEMAQRILGHAGIEGCKVIPCSSAYYPLAAPRPRMEAGRNYNLELMGLHIMRPWQDALKEYVEANWVEQQYRD